MDKDFLKGMGLGVAILGLGSLFNKKTTVKKNPKPNKRKQKLIEDLDSPDSIYYEQSKDMKQRLINFQNDYFLTFDEVQEIREYIESIEDSVPEKLIKPDRGASISGNGISVFGIHTKGKRKPSEKTIWWQSWTQAEQPDAINWILKKVYKKFPDYKEAITYDYGRMS